MPKRPRSARPTGSAFDSRHSLVTADPMNPLQILFRPRGHAIERLVDVLDRVGNTETQVAFTEIPECGTRQRGNAGIIEQCVGQFLGRPAGFGDVWKNVEGTVRRTA